MVMTMQNVDFWQRRPNELQRGTLKENPSIRLIRKVPTGYGIRVDATPSEVSVIPDEKDLDTGARKSRSVDIEGPEVECRKMLKSELREVDRSIAGNDDGNFKAELFKLSRKDAENICQPSDFYVGHALTGEHDNVHASRHRFSRSPTLALGESRDRQL
jgi:hypothetical protein